MTNWQQNRQASKVFFNKILCDKMSFLKNLIFKYLHLSRYNEYFQKVVGLSNESQR